MTYEEIPRTLQRLIIVTVPSAGYAQNEEMDALLGHGYDFTSEVGESISRMLNTKRENCHVISFGASAFRDAGAVIVSACRKSRRSSEYPLTYFDAHLDTERNQYRMLLGNTGLKGNGDRFFNYLMVRTDGADTVVLVTGCMVGVNLAKYMCGVLGIKDPESNPLCDPTVDLRLVIFSFADKKVSFELRPVE